MYGKKMIKANFHTHTTWCDGKDTPEAVIQSAIKKGFSAIGFSSHAMLPENLLDWVLVPGKAEAYADEIRFLAKKYSDKIKVYCGVEADYVPGGATPDRLTYASIKPDYIIGSVHFVKAPDGSSVAVDLSPEDLLKGIEEHFDGSVEAYIRAYFAQEREMVANFNFDIIGHPDLVRKFNLKSPYFDENAAWYIEELIKTADAIAKSGKIVEVNTGAISRGWLNDAYPSCTFRDLLRERGVKFILNSDAHAADAIDCAFDRFALSEEWINLSF
jgi:histidinol-phosphatase (PHP family)